MMWRLIPESILGLGDRMLNLGYTVVQRDFIFISLPQDKADPGQVHGKRYILSLGEC
jgi:hypothetical protein